jgi:hypothetical protein
VPVLRVIPGEDGQCKRCEAFMIANGVQMQKIKSIKGENARLKARLAHVSAQGTF